MAIATIDVALLSSTGTTETVIHCTVEPVLQEQS